MSTVSCSANELIPLVYDELRQVARRFHRRQIAAFTLQPTELVDEACLQLLDRGSGNWQNIDHFRAIAVRKIWQVVVDHIRRRNAVKRGGRSPLYKSSDSRLRDAADPRPAAAAVPRRVELDSVVIDWHDRTIELIDLANALDTLGREDSRLRDVVMLHWFGGLTLAQTGQELHVSPSTVEKDFRFALAWLNRALQGGVRRGN